MKRFFSLTTVLFLVCKIAFTQPLEQRFKIIVAPDHHDWLYKTGEKVNFDITVLENGNLCKNVTVRYLLGPERLDATKQGKLFLTDGKTTIDGGTLKTPGFIRCIVHVDTLGGKYRNLATAGFSVSSIKPTVALPTDFIDFWNKGKDSLAKVPIDARIILLPERCTEKVNVYEVNLQNFNKSRFYGVLCVPKAPGKYPALLTVPGAGVRPYYGNVGTAEKGVITLDVGIHGIPVTMDPKIYDALQKGALYDYPSYNSDDKDKYYYKAVYLGCVRANDFLCSFPEFDGVNLGVMGGSQGGALAIVTGALDRRVKDIVSEYPALSDMTGYLHGRAGGWPHFFDKTHIESNNYERKITTLAYYDVVNFARQLIVPIKMSWGFNDETCPPTSSYAVYNAITAPKSVEIYADTGHWLYPEQATMLWTWMMHQLNPNIKLN